MLTDLWLLVAFAFGSLVGGESPEMTDLTFSKAGGEARSWQPASPIQSINGNCRMEAMPALPANANQAAPAARAGFVWEMGAYRCRQGSWEFVPGHWERSRAAYRPNPLAMIEVRQGRVHARPGFEIVQQGSGAVLRQTRAGNGPGALAAVRGEFRCGCDNGTGNCSVSATGNTIYCLSQNCTGTCNMITTFPSPRGGAISYRIEMPCGEVEAEEAVSIAIL